MIAWMLYCAVAGTLVAIAARCAERVSRVAAIPIRWIWAAALAGTLALGALAPLRQVTRTVSATGTSTGIAVDALPLQAGFDAVSRQLPSSAALVVATAWGVASALLLAVVVGVHVRLRAARRRWPVADLHGSRVRVSPDTGPLVIGVRRPEIVVPRWILDRDLNEQRLIVAHEAEHVRANDTLLLGGGVVAAALMPWNPAVWYMFSRLRLAVELDCDARLLRRGISVESYGSLLLHVATHASPLRFGAPALANSPSHLRQRIIAMQHNVSKYARLRAGVVGVFGVAALLAACEAEMPTAADVNQMDVGAAEQRLTPLMEDGAAAAAIYLIDDRRVTRAEALALRSEDVTGIEVVRGTTEPTKFVITTRNGSKPVALDFTPGPLVIYGDSGPGKTQLRAEQALQGRSNAAPLILIDGKRSTADDLRRLDRDAIESVEVLKGRAAAALLGYSAADVANGVIRIVTKRGGAAQ